MSTHAFPVDFFCTSISLMANFRLQAPSYSLSSTMHTDSTVQIRNNLNNSTSHNKWENMGSQSLTKGGLPFDFSGLWKVYHCLGWHCKVYIICIWCIGDPTLPGGQRFCNNHYECFVACCMHLSVFTGPYGWISLTMIRGGETDHLSHWPTDWVPLC